MNKAKHEITRDKFLDREERKQLLKTCKDRAELDLLHGRSTWVVRYMLIDLALYSGLRVAEIAALKIGDLYLRAKDPYIMVWRGKGNKKREVYLDSGLVKHLKEFIHLKRTTLGEDIEPTAPLFAGRDGNNCQPITLMKSFKRAIKEAGLPDRYSIHSARHTYATFLLHDTENLRYVQRQLGHTNISMTALYSDILPEENSQLANQIVRD
jgi:site-specific recombinase XerD